MFSSLRRGLAAGVVSVCALGAALPAAAVTLEITVTNHQEAGGLYLTPFLLVAHDGSFDAFDRNQPASAALEALAEEGDVSGLRAQAGMAPSAVAANPDGFGGAPVLDPGESATVTLRVDPASERFLSFFSMVIPSNDTFLGNARATQYRLFDSHGRLRLSEILINGGAAWDAGTEVNNGQGAAFNTAGGIGVDENGVVRRARDLGFLLGANTAAGTSVDSVPGRRDLFASIQIAAVPLPAGLPLLVAALGGLGLAARRRRAT